MWLSKFVLRMRRRHRRHGEPAFYAYSSDGMARLSPASFEQPYHRRARVVGGDAYEIMTPHALTCKAVFTPERQCRPLLTLS